MLAHTSDASNWLDIITRRTEMAFPKMHVFEFLLAGSHEEWPKFSHALRRARCVTGRRVREGTDLDTTELGTSPG